MYQIHCDSLQINTETQTVGEISQFVITNNVDYYFDEDMSELLKNLNFEDLLHSNSPDFCQVWHCIDQ